MTTQGDNLHYIALAAFAAGVEEGSLQDVESLMLDVKVYDMLQKVSGYWLGKAGRERGSHHPVTDWQELA